MLQPIRQASVSVDYYNIKINNDIISAFEAGGLGAGYISTVRGSPTTPVQRFLQERAPRLVS